jgi:glycine oxidase
MIDYIIIGKGLAGIAFAETALQNNKSIVVFDNNSQNSSKIAAGIYNPIILKRFTIVAEAQEQLTLLNFFYSKLEKKLNQKFDFEMPVFRKFFSIEEQNNWFLAHDKPKLSPFLDATLNFDALKNIDSPYGFGKVLQTGYVDTASLIAAYTLFLKSNQLLQQESFDYTALQIHSDYVEYKNIKAKHIVFAEGFGMHFNPFFKHLLLDGTKGEVLLVKAPNLDLNVILNSSLYLVPLGNDLYKIGATYEWEDKSQLPTDKVKSELLEKLKEIITCDFEVVAHLAGVRPTVRDRNPLIGSHPDYKNIHILNGLGTRGVMLAPYLAQKLFDFIENGIALPKEMDCKRYDKLRF